MNVMVHPSAIVDQGATIGDGTRIWHFPHVSAGAVIGRGCTLGQNVYVGGKASIDDNVKIPNKVSVHDGVTLEDDVFCGPSAVFTNVVNPRAAIVRRGEYRSTIVRRGATLGANCTIVCGVTIGAHAFVAAGAAVTRDVPAFARVVGGPARHTGWISRFGERLTLPLTGPAEASCPGSGERYKVVDGVCFVVAHDPSHHTESRS